MLKVDPPSPLPTCRRIQLLFQRFRVVSSPKVVTKEELAESTGLIRKAYVSIMDTNLHNTSLRIERKQFAFDLKENPQGTFLRITETVTNGRRDSIVIPVTGLEQFRDLLNEVIKSVTTPVASPAILPLGQPKPEPPTPNLSA